MAPPSLRWAINEMLLGSNPAVAMFAASYGFAKLLHVLGNDEQKKLRTGSSRRAGTAPWC